MLKLSVRSQGGIGVEIAAPIPLPTAAAGEEWEQIAAGFLIYAFAGRAVWFIADDERATQWAFPETLARQTETRVDGTLFRFAFTEACPPEALASLVGTGDFHWDAVWIAAPGEKERAPLDELIRACTVSSPEGVPQTGVEVMLPIGDGSGLWWINPSRDEQEIVAKLNDLTRSVGWSLDAEGAGVPADGD